MSDPAVASAGATSSAPIAASVIGAVASTVRSCDITYRNSYSPGSVGSLRSSGEPARV